MTALDRLLAKVADLPTTVEDRAAWVEARAIELADVLGDAMVALLEPVLSAQADKLTAAIDPSFIDPLAAIWRSFVVEVAGEYTAGMYLSGSLSVWVGLPGAGVEPEIAAGWADVVNRNAVEYQTTATNRIVDASADTWADVQTRSVAALQDGVEIPKLRKEIEAVTGYAKSRAQAIARTETLSAYSGGELAGARALGENGPQFKRWLAADDARTRPTHNDADGQLQRLADQFRVGGVTMDRPLDPNAPAGEVVNCRCTMLLLWEDDLTADERASMGVAAPVAEPEPTRATAPTTPYVIMDKRLDASPMGNDDWRTMNDPMKRATAVWQHNYDSMYAIRAAEVNLRAGREALADVVVPNVKPLRLAKAFLDDEFTEVLTPADMANELARAAHVLRDRLDQATPDAPTLFRGMTVGDDFDLAPGQSFDLDVTSFTDDIQEAEGYTQNDYSGYRKGDREVVIEMKPGATAVSLGDDATGRMAGGRGSPGSREWIYQGRMVIESVEDRKGVLYAIATPG